MCISLFACSSNDQKKTLSNDNSHLGDSTFLTLWTNKSANWIAHTKFGQAFRRKSRQAIPERKYSSPILEWTAIKNRGLEQSLSVSSRVGCSSKIVFGFACNLETKTEENIKEKLQVIHNKCWSQKLTEMQHKSWGCERSEQNLKCRTNGICSLLAQRQVPQFSCENEKMKQAGEMQLGRERRFTEPG